MVKKLPPQLLPRLARAVSDVTPLEKAFRQLRWVQVTILRVSTRFKWHLIEEEGSPVQSMYRLGTSGDVLIENKFAIECFKFQTCIFETWRYVNMQ